MGVYQRCRWLAAFAGLFMSVAAGIVPAARAQTEPPANPVAPASASVPPECLVAFGPSDLPGAVIRDTHLAIADTPAGTVFSLSGCVQTNGPAGSFAAYLIKGLIFDTAGNLLVFATTETAPVASPAAPDRPTARTWAMAANTGYPIGHAQIRPEVLLIVYGRACPDGATATCAKPGYDTGPVYFLVTPCVTDGAGAVRANAAGCTTTASAAPKVSASTVAPARAATTVPPAAPPPPGGGIPPLGVTMAPAPAPPSAAPPPASPSSSRRKAKRPPRLRPSPVTTRKPPE
jgi:hypothetical protein